MPEVVARKCPNCAGSLPPLGQGSSVRCEYCGHEFDVARTVAQPQVPPPQPRPAPYFPQQPWPTPGAPPARRTGVGLVLVPLLITLGIGAFTFLRFAGSGGPATLLSGLGDGTAGMMWMRTVGLYQVDGDGIEDPVMMQRSGGGADEMFLVTWTGATMQEKWRAGPFGTFGQAQQFTQASVVGNRALVADFRAQLHLYDLASGAAVASVALPDRASRVCRAAGPMQVGLLLQDGRSVVVDAATGATSLATPGFDRECEPPSDGVTRVGIVEQPSGAQVGLEGEQVLVEAEVRVAVGRRATGIRVPVAVGLGPDGRTPAWSVVIPTVDEATVAESGSDALAFALAQGRLYAAYALGGGGGGRLAALDARTGARLWETPFSSWKGDVGIDAMRVGPRRIVIEEFLEAAVFDAQTGALLTRVATR